MIVVEGMDNTGKTTLVTKLANDLKLVSITNKQRPKSLTDSLKYLNSVLPLIHSFPTVFDRWQAISEPIYGPICRNTSLFSQRDIDHQLERIQVYSPLIIYCRPSDEKILDWGDREQMAGVIEQSHKLIEAYDAEMDVLQREWFHVIRYDYEHTSYDWLKRIVLELKGPK